MGEQIRVMIVDDHDMVRMGLKTYFMLDDQIDIVAEAGNGEEALKCMDRMEESERPDVVIMDLMMPVMDGVETTRQMTMRYPGVKIVMLTSFLEDDKVVEAIEAGAVTYVLKTVSSEQLSQVVGSVYRGMPVMNADVSQAMARGIRQRLTAKEDEGLTAREREVLLMIAEGMTNKDIALELHISIKTVKTHVSNLLMKCEAVDRTQLAIYAHRKGLV